MLLPFSVILRMQAAVGQGLAKFQIYDTPKHILPEKKKEGEREGEKWKQRRRSRRRRSEVRFTL